ncbi:hypothetical protein DOE76_16170 [Leifsonia sp. ku-ls]|nr:hypothetical protein DOE76_16170 [Leifsonia sp. ku-ls]
MITAVSLAGLAVFLGILHSLLAGPPARALTGDGHGPGYMSSDGWWLGSYHLDDGALGFCLHPGKKAPTGLPYSYADAASTGWWTPEQSAVFAHIARTWAGTGDRVTAAAGQLTTWMYAGLSAEDARVRADRAGGDAEAVFIRAKGMLEEAVSRASTGVRAAAVVELAESGPGRVRVELTVDRLSGPDLLPPGAHEVQATLSGATFADGSAASSIPTGTDVDIVPTGTSPSVSVSATATTGDLPYGNRLTVALPAVDAQAVLIAQPSSATASATADATGPSPLPFQPRVETQTSAPEARPGAEITDTLLVSVDTAADGLLPSWGVRPTDDGFSPVRAVVESTLLGPFDQPIAPAPEAPAGAPVVCTVETVVEGVGRYTTPSCVVPTEGYYVWTERIDPERTDPAEGGVRLRAWQSSFGVASEVTRVTTPATPAPAAAQAELAATGAADSVLPALCGTGAGVAGAAMVAVARVRGRRPARGANGRAIASGGSDTRESAAPETLLTLEGLIASTVDEDAPMLRPRRARHARESARPTRSPRVVAGRLVGPRRPRSTWFGQ